MFRRRSSHREDECIMGPSQATEEVHDGEDNYEAHAYVKRWSASR